MDAEACETGIRLPDLGFRAYVTYESDVLYVLRFMIDLSIVGGNWVEVFRTLLSFVYLLVTCFSLHRISFCGGTSQLPVGKYSVRQESPNYLEYAALSHQEQQRVPYEARPRSKLTSSCHIEADIRYAFSFFLCNFNVHYTSIVDAPDGCLFSALVIL